MYDFSEALKLLVRSTPFLCKDLYDSKPEQISGFSFKIIETKDCGGTKVEVLEKKYVEDDGIEHTDFIAYFKEGTCLAHRLDGPAIEWFGVKGNPKDEAYYVLGKEFTKEEFYAPGMVDAYLLENS